MAEQRERPLSPHLGIWRWGPGMAASIFHRISGGALTVAGLAVLTWWLLALAKGADAYGDFLAIAKTWVGVSSAIGGDQFSEAPAGATTEFFASRSSSAMCARRDAAASPA